jgi:signal transduction histidine kinase/ActR/RegA family two-component response regulator
VLLPILPAVILSVFTFAAERRVAVNEARAEILRVARATSGEQDQLFAGVRDLLTVMARQPEARLPTGAACRGLVTSLMSPFFVNLGIATTQGEIRCSAASPRTGVSIADEPYLERVIRARQFVVGTLSPERVTGRAGVPVAHPIVDEDGRLRGVAYAALDPEWLAQLAARAEVPAGARVFIVDAGGVVVARVAGQQPAVGRLLPAVVERAVQLGSGEHVLPARGLDGAPQMYAVTPVRGVNDAGRPYVVVEIPLAVALAPAQRVFVQSLSGLALVGILAFLGTWVGGSFLFLRPVNRLVAAARRLSAGDLSTRTGLAAGGDELGQLARAFDEMASSIERHLAEQKRAEEARLAGEAAEKASRAKSEFLSRMSHELRTPLNAILGFGQLMEMSTHDAEQRDNVEQILRAGKHLLDLINEVLDIARIEAGRLAISPEAVSLRELLEECVSLIGPLAAGEAIRLEGPAGDGQEPYVLADRQRLKQVVLNLLSNAVKYNRRGGIVRIAVDRPTNGRLRFGISDTGPGIPPHLLSRLFTPFERLPDDEMRSEGTGLGLALSRGLAEAMGGTITVESVVGQGSTFWVELALAEPPANVAGMALGSTPPGSAARTLLYIEDNLSNLRLIESLLVHRPNVRLLSAMQGRLGLDLALEHRPDLILLDMHLPDIPGEEVLLRLRAAPETRQAPVVMISADPTAGQGERLQAMGARAYLSKPLDIKQLLGLLDEAMLAPPGGPRNT